MSLKDKLIIGFIIIFLIIFTMVIDKNVVRS